MAGTCGTMAINSTVGKWRWRWCGHVRDVQQVLRNVKAGEQGKQTRTQTAPRVLKVQGVNVVPAPELKTIRRSRITPLPFAFTVASARAASARNSDPHKKKSTCLVGSAESCQRWQLFFCVLVVVVNNLNKWLDMGCIGVIEFLR